MHSAVGRCLRRAIFGEGFFRGFDATIRDRLGQTFGRRIRASADACFADQSHAARRTASPTICGVIGRIDTPALAVDEIRLADAAAPCTDAAPWTDKPAASAVS